MNTLLWIVGVWVGLNLLLVFWMLWKSSREEDPMEFLMVFDYEDEDGL